MLQRILGAVGAFAALAAALASPAQAMGAEGFTSPARGATLTGGSLVEARWTAPPQDDARGGPDEAELVLSLDGGRTFSVRLSPELSPEVTSYRWRVPDVGTSSARLALRVGVGRGVERERLLLVSEEFAIASESAEPDALAPGSSESWTEQALSERTVRDLLQASMKTPPAERIVAPAADTEADRPGPALSLAPPSSCPSRIAIAATVTGASSSLPVPPASTSAPLRL